MGIFDRDYMQGGGSTGNMIRQLSAVNWILILNIAVFLGWTLGAPSTFMRENFLVSWYALMSGRVWTVLTCAFSHYDMWHILINMLIFLSFGPVLEARWGKRRFLVFYLLSAVFSSLAMALMAPVFGLRDVNGLGASGAVCAVSTAFAIYYPKNFVLIWGIIPAPAWLVVAALCVWDVKGLMNQFKGISDGVAHSAHLGGCLFALIVLFLVPRLVKVSPPSRSPVGRSRQTGSRDPSEYYPAPSDGDDRDRGEENRLDDLLTKVSREGIDSLTDDEKDDLKRISRKRRDSS